MQDDVGEVREVSAPAPAPADDGPGLPGAFSSPRQAGADAGDSKEAGPEGAAAPASSSTALAVSSASDSNLIRGASRSGTGFCLPGCSSAEVGVGIEPPPPPPNEEAMPLPMMPVMPPEEAAAPEPEGPGTLARLSESVTRNLPNMPSAQMPDRLRKVASASPSAMCWSALRKAPRVYCEKMARFPWAFLLLYIIIIVTTIAAGWSARKLEIDTNLEQFRRVDGNASAVHASYNEALKYQRAIRNGSALIDRRSFELEIFYQAKSGSIFSEASLRDIRSLEHLLRNLPGWISMCDKADERAKFRCEPGESLGNYAWPQREELLDDAHTPFSLDFDGKSRERLPVHALLTYLNEGMAVPHELRKFLPHGFAGPEQDTNLLRSIFAFTEPNLDDSSYESDYKAFVANELFPALQNATQVAEQTPDDPWVEPWNVSIYFRGHFVDDHEVRVTLEQDMTWAIGSLVLMFVIMWLQLRSLFLAFSGLTTISLVPLLAYVFVPIKEVSIASFLCVFLVIGLGSNHLLASSEHWRRIGRELKWAEPRVVIVPDRSAVDAYYTLRLTKLFPKLALRFLPELFSMCCFLVLLASLLRPMREFGMYMFACMASTALLCFTVFVPLLVIHDAFILPLAKKLHPQVGMILEPEQLRFPWRPAAGYCIKVARKAGIWILGGTSLVTLVIFIIMVVVAANSDNPGLPEVFSPSNHRHASRPLIEAFMPTKPADEPPPFKAYICDPGTSSGTLKFGDGSSEVCGLYWCEAPLPESEAAAATPASANATVEVECSCNEPKTSLSPDCENITWDAELVGQAFVDLSSSKKLDTWTAYLNGLFANSQVDASGTTVSRLPSLVLEHWESGKTDVEPQVRMPSMTVRVTPLSSQSYWKECSHHTTCFCGPRKCAPSSKYREKAGIFTVESSRRLSSQPPLLPVYHRRLSEDPPIPAPSAKEVVVVYGILPQSSEPFFSGGPAWSYDSSFEPVSPWAQRAMLYMCTEIPSNLNVLEKQCWMIEFRQWMLSRGKKFPTQRFGDFQAELQEFGKLYPNAATAMWLNENNEMRATAFSFKVPPRQDAWASEILEDRTRWDTYVAGQNEQAASSASNAFATAQVWVDAEAQDAAMRNAWHVLLMAIGIMILAGVIYTWDGLFMLMTIAISVLACIWISFWIFCIFGWAAGPWELILLIAIPSQTLEPVFRIGRGAVWSDYNVQKKIMAQLSPRSQAAQREQPGAQPGAPLAIQDDGAPPGPPGGIPPEPAMGAEADLLSTGSATEAKTLSDAQSRFEARMLKYVLSVANGTFGNSIKMILCGILMLPCEFRLFVRMGAVAIVVPLVALPCIFILLPAALFLLPRQDLPDAVRLSNFVMSKVQGDRS